MTQGRRKVPLILRTTCQLLWVTALVVGLSGVFLLLKYHRSSIVFSHSYILLPGALATASAALLFVSGCICRYLSTIPSAQHGLFVYLLIVVFCLESTASVFAYFYSGQLNSDLSALSGVFSNYKGTTKDPASLIVDTMQAEFQCCGVHDYRDWLETKWFNQSGGHGPPHSCCNVIFHSCNASLSQTWQLYHEGCHAKVREAFCFMLHLINWLSLLVLAVEIQGFVVVGQLMARNRFHKYHSVEENYRHCNT